MRSLLTAALLLSALFVPAAASAHQTAKSSLSCAADEADGLLSCALTLSGDDLAHYLQLDPDGDGHYKRADLDVPRARAAALEHLRAQLRVANAGAPCAPSGADTLAPAPDQPSQVRASLAWRCELPWRTLEITDAIMVNTPGGYRHLGHLQVGQHQLTTVFDAANVDAALTISDRAPSTLPHTLSRYIGEGVIHILAGADHVLFVLVLALGASRLRVLLGMVTAFTLAHSLTLAISALGLITPPAAVIEPLIALSILLTAAAAARRAWRGEQEQEPGRAAWASALVAPFLFGLLHGFGFSYVLRDEVGLPQGALIPALGAFNVGVELGQLAILAIAAPALALLKRRRPAAYRLVVLIACALLGAIALYWTIERVFFT